MDKLPICKRCGKRQTFDHAKAVRFYTAPKYRWSALDIAATFGFGSPHPILRMLRAHKVVISPQGQTRKAVRKWGRA